MRFREVRRDFYEIIALLGASLCHTTLNKPLHDETLFNPCSDSSAVGAFVSKNKKLTRTRDSKINGKIDREPGPPPGLRIRLGSAPGGSQADAPSARGVPRSLRRALKPLPPVFSSRSPAVSRSRRLAATGRGKIDVERFALL